MPVAKRFDSIRFFFVFTSLSLTFSSVLRHSQSTYKLASIDNFNKYVIVLAVYMAYTFHCGWRISDRLVY